MTRKLVVETPIGTFTRKTERDYQFISVWRWTYQPYRNVHTPDGALVKLPNGTYLLEPDGEPRQRDDVKWSRTYQGALKARSIYAPKDAQFFGPYPVEAC